MKAYELLSDPKNWKQEGGNYTGGPCCIVVAIAKCYFTEFKTMATKVVKHLRLKVSLGEWNDAPERTHSEVVNVLRELDI